VRAHTQPPPPTHTHTHTHTHWRMFAFTQVWAHPRNEFCSCCTRVHGAAGDRGWWILSLKVLQELTLTDVFAVHPAAAACVPSVAPTAGTAAAARDRTTLFR
jgi:hypothetical protein